MWLEANYRVGNNSIGVGDGVKLGLHQPPVGSGIKQAGFEKTQAGGGVHLEGVGEVVVQLTQDKPVDNLVRFGETLVQELFFVLMSKHKLEYRLAVQSLQSRVVLTMVGLGERVGEGQTNTGLHLKTVSFPLSFGEHGDL